jgi:hypothetical protein
MIKSNNSLKLVNSKKNSQPKELTKKPKSGLPVLLEPNIHDIYDELSRMDSFAYSRYNK